MRFVLFVFAISFPSFVRPITIIANFAMFAKTKNELSENTKDSAPLQIVISRTYAIRALTMRARSCKKGTSFGG